ncbi:sensor histidine kinase [Aquibacillus salsiterrae]|uniref:Oxygen sensor histidine kinase NreB n=1 Tax=Aquibacillus salsiterrae TaxID=2950439 RepID=A0A9X3WG80_9BACI|nr:ATP-binding protein [Aquibacillus salsiterrae]MDC3417861.1 histidine kinase [Aquibacillus salsiterrae]
MELEASKHATTYIIKSLDEEIKRIALELHEGVSQHLYSIHTGLEYINSIVDHPDLKHYVRDLSENVSRTIKEVRFLSAELYPSTLESLGITAAVKSYSKLFTATFGIVVKVTTTGEAYPIDEDRSMALFRACQEAMINMAKYADTSTAVIAFKWKQDMLQLIIEDDGKGFDVRNILDQNECMGLASMKYRLEIAGGGFAIYSAEGKGTIVCLSLPKE